MVLRDILFSAGGLILGVALDSFIRKVIAPFLARIKAGLAALDKAAADVKKDL